MQGRVSGSSTDSEPETYGHFGIGDNPAEKVEGLNGLWQSDGMDGDMFDPPEQLREAEEFLRTARAKFEHDTTKRQETLDSNLVTLQETLRNLDLKSSNLTEKFGILVKEADDLRLKLSKYQNVSDKRAPNSPYRDDVSDTLSQINLVDEVTSTSRNIDELVDRMDALDSKMSKVHQSLIHLQQKSVETRQSTADWNKRIRALKRLSLKPIEDLQTKIDEVSLKIRKIRRKADQARQINCERKRKANVICRQTDQTHIRTLEKKRRTEGRMKRMETQMMHILEREKAIKDRIATLRDRKSVV
jgi:chromosome segregation ATPase